MENMSMSIRIRLSVMMFLQFMLFAVWWQPLAAYLGNELGLTGGQMSPILNTMALGCLIAPIIGMIADRYFASQKVLAVLNLLGAVLLIVAAKQTNPVSIFVVLLLQQLCYMPTWGLTTSIAMSNSSTEAFPQIRVFGSIGWVASGVFGFVALKMFGKSIDGTEIPFYCGAGISLAAAALALTIPNTPPPAKGQKASVIDVLGLRSVTLLKDFNFLMFIVVSTLMMIPFSIYWSYCSVFLSDKGFALITATMNWGQFVEMFVMAFLLPLVLVRLGLKWVMSLGLGIMVVRYLFFLGGSMTDQSWMYMGAILVHGFIYSFFFVGGQMYVGKKAPPQLQAQAQGFLFLIMFGIGLLVGNTFNGKLIDKHSSPILATASSYQVADGSTVGTDAITVAGAKIAGAKLYDRTLNDTEVQVLATTNEKKRENLIAEAAALAEPVTVALDEGVQYDGNWDGLSNEMTASAFTFTGQLILPADDPDSADDDVLSGTLLKLGEGDDALELALQDNGVVIKAGADEIVARSIGFSRGDDAPTYLAISKGPDGMKLYTNGSAYRTYDWQPIWSLTTICSVVLLGLIIVGFHFKEEKETKPEASSDTTDNAE